MIWEKNKQKKKLLKDIDINILKVLTMQLNMRLKWAFLMSFFNDI
jgi:hypothetical protein